jgi:hypothetical protein
MPLTEILFVDMLPFTEASDPKYKRRFNETSLKALKTLNAGDRVIVGVVEV